LTLLICIIRGLHLMYHWRSWKAQQKLKDAGVIVLLTVSNACRLLQAISLTGVHTLVWPYAQATAMGLFFTASMMILHKWLVLSNKTETIFSDFEQEREVRFLRLVKVATVAGAALAWAFAVAVYVIITLHKSIKGSLETGFYCAFGITTSSGAIVTFVVGFAVLRSSIRAVVDRLGHRLAKPLNDLQFRATLLCGLCAGSYALRLAYDVFICSSYKTEFVMKHSVVIYLVAIMVIEALPTTAIVLLMGPHSPSRRLVEASVHLTDLSNAPSLNW